MVLTAERINTVTAL